MTVRTRARRLRQGDKVGPGVEKAELYELMKLDQRRSLEELGAASGGGASGHCGRGQDPRLRPRSPLAFLGVARWASFRS